MEKILHIIGLALYEEKKSQLLLQHQPHAAAAHEEPHGSSPMRGGGDRGFTEIDATSE